MNDPDTKPGQEQPMNPEIRCIACGLRVADSIWCMETRDGDHRPTLD